MSAIDELLDHHDGDHHKWNSMTDFSCQARAELARLRADASEADALRSTVAEQARQIEAAYKILNELSRISVDGVELLCEQRQNINSWCDAWLAANTPTPAPEAATAHCSKCGCLCVARAIDSFGVCEVCNSYD